MEGEAESTTIEREVVGSAKGISDLDCVPCVWKIIPHSYCDDYNSYDPYEPCNEGRWKLVAQKYQKESAVCSSVRGKGTGERNDNINISTAFSVPFDAAATAAVVVHIVGIFSIFDDACIADIMDVTYIVHDSLWGLRRLLLGEW